MYEFIGPKNTGKTYQLITVAKLYSGYILTPDASDVNEKLKRLGMTLQHEPLSFDDFLKNIEKIQETDLVFIDDMETFIRFILKNKLIISPVKSVLIHCLYGYNSTSYDSLQKLKNWVGFDFDHENK